MDSPADYLHYLVWSFFGLIWPLIVLIVTWLVYRLARKSKDGRQKAIRFNLFFGMSCWIMAGTLMFCVAQPIEQLQRQKSTSGWITGKREILEPWRKDWEVTSLASRGITKVYVFLVHDSDDKEDIESDAWGLFFFGCCYFMGAFLLHLGMFAPLKATLGIPVKDDTPA